MRALISCRVAALLLVATGCHESFAPETLNDPTLAAAETNTTVSEIPTEFTAFNECTGEDVAWVGTIRLVEHSVTNRGVELEPGQAQHTNLNITLRLTGTGQQSGGTYRLLNTHHVSVQSESPVNPYPTVFRDAFRERVTGPSGRRSRSRPSFST